MGIEFARQLKTVDQIHTFMEEVLKFDYKKYPKLIENILAGEMGVDIKEQTLNSTAFRDRKCVSDSDRWRMRAEIVDELYSQPRLAEDEQIRRYFGGALPLTSVKSDKQAFLITGLPASGKSTIANKIADDYGAIIVDSDYAKRKLPEFKKHSFGASVVHKESSRITMGFKDDNPNKLESLYEKCITNSNNIVIPTIGESAADIIQYANVLAKYSYDVHLVLVSLPRREATIRAIMRFKKTKRYVPIGLIFDGYGNDPIMVYYYLRCRFNNLFKSMGCLSNLVKFKSDPICTDFLGNSPVMKYTFEEQIL